MYSVIPDLVNRDCYQQFLSEARWIIDPQTELSAAAEFEDLAFSMAVLCQKSPEQYLAAMRVIGKLTSLHAVLETRVLECYLRKKHGFQIITMCGQPVLHVSGEPVSIGNYDADVSWHQDWPNTGGSKNSVVLWLPLGGCNSNEGGLILAEGTAFPLLEYSSDAKVCRIRDELAAGLVENYVAPEFGAGILFDQFHPHCSRSGKGVRIAVSFRYEDPSCPDWQSRGYEYLHQRSKVDRDFADW